MDDTPTNSDSPSAEDVAALRAIVEGTAHHTGQAFFECLVRHLATAVGTRYAFIAEFVGRNAGAHVGVLVSGPDHRQRRVGRDR